MEIVWKITFVAQFEVSCLNPSGLSFRRQLQQQLDPEEFTTWFRPLKVRDEDGDRLVLVAPNSRFLHTLEESYRRTVDRAVAGLGGPGFEVLFSLEDGRDPLGRAPITPSSLNPKYMFANFVVGKSNEFAHAAAKAVAENPSHSYNPLFLYGGVGLGKTHLLHAIGHEILRNQPAICASSTWSPSSSSTSSSTPSASTACRQFRERYRTIDVLMIDDVQFIANKERTQEEFFHTFNTLYTSQKQIILSSDSSPRNIPTLEERLRSRFEWGLIADIQPPDLETKVAILQRKASPEGVQLPDEVAEFIAQQVQVEHPRARRPAHPGHRLLLTRPASRCRRPWPARRSRTSCPRKGRSPTPNEIIKFVARHYDLKVSEIKSKSNSRQIVFPRQVAMYLCKKLTELSYPDIGKLFNDKHHSTVMYSVDKVQKKRDGPDSTGPPEFEQHF